MEGWREGGTEGRREGGKESGRDGGKELLNNPDLKFSVGFLWRGLCTLGPGVAGVQRHGEVDEPLFR